MEKGKNEKRVKKNKKLNILRTNTILYNN